MKKINEVSVMAVSAVAFTLSIIGASISQAATTPSLGQAASFSVLSGTYTNTIAGTTINGDLGFTTGPVSAPTVSGTTHTADSTYNQAGIDQNSALSALASQPCTFTFPSGPVDLATETTHGTVGLYTPGVYCTTSSSAASIGSAGIELNGSGTYIFRINGALTTVANSHVTLTGGATACNVFWTPTSATTLGANSTFLGTDIDAAGITIGSTVTWSGRALAFGGTVSTNNDTITAPTSCSATTTTTTTTTPTLLNSEDIKVTKDANKKNLQAGPEKVKFSYKVTNEGDTPLTEVSLKDDKCDDVNRVSGDKNDDDILDLNEEWKYECTKTVKKTETNIATAKGHAYGEEVKDQATFKVTVSTPSLPSAGFEPSTNLFSEIWNNIMSTFSF
jgi:hypothetical protein